MLSLRYYVVIVNINLIEQHQYIPYLVSSRSKLDTQLHRNMVSSYSATDLLVDTQLHWNMVSNYSATDLLVDTQLHRNMVSSYSRQYLPNRTASIYSILSVEPIETTIEENMMVLY
jgi:hypothetical protein